MATKSKKRKRGKRGLGDTEPTADPVVVNVATGAGTAGRKATGFANGLFKTEGDDSILKTVVVYGAAAYGAYFGLKLLINVVGKDVKTAREDNKRADIETRADAGKDPVAILSKQLAVAINPEWKSDQPKVPPGYFTDANEVEVFRILAGPTSKNWLNQLVVERFAPVVNSKQSWLGVSAAYLVLTGRALDFDLRNHLGSWDYQQLSPYLNRIMCYDRRVKVDPTTKKQTVSIVKTC